MFLKCQRRILRSKKSMDRTLYPVMFLPWVYLRLENALMGIEQHGIKEKEHIFLDNINLEA